MDIVRIYTICICSIFLSFSGLYGQEKIQMIEYNGVYCIPCTVNGKKINMVFDTGASMVSISQALAKSMLKDGKLSISDFDNPLYTAVLADGSVIESETVNLKSIKIGSTELNDIKAIVVDHPSAMLIFGQSAIQELGEYSIKGDILTLYGQYSAQSKIFDNNWDRQNRKFISSTYGLQWKLPEGLGFRWEREKNNEKHTIFKASCGPFEVHINAQVTKAIDLDVWGQYETLKLAFKYTDEIVSKETGCKVVYSNLERSIHELYKCLKREMVYSFDYNGKKYEEYTQTLVFAHNNNIIQVVIAIDNSLLKQFPKDIEDAIEEIFDGFSLIN